MNQIIEFPTATKFVEMMTSNPTEIFSFEKADWTDPYYVAGFVDSGDKINQIKISKKDKNYRAAEESIRREALRLKLNHYTGTVETAILSEDIFMKFKPYERMGEGIPKSETITSMFQWQEAVKKLDKDATEILKAYLGTTSAHLDAIKNNKHYILSIYEDSHEKLNSIMKSLLNGLTGYRLSDKTAFVEGMK
jgi:hypothetical protein